MKIENVVLDLDHTLITSVTVSEVGARELARLKSIHNYHTFKGYTIFERPGLREFLGYLSRNYKVAVWTAAGQEYGEFIVKNIIHPYLGKQVSFFLHDRNCLMSHKATGILKHLDMIYGSMNKYSPNNNFQRFNTVIVDDNEGILSQNNFVIHIKKFYPNVPDAELLRLVRTFPSRGGLRAQ